MPGGHELADDEEAKRRILGAPTSFGSCEETPACCIAAAMQNGWLGDVQATQMVERGSCGKRESWMARAADAH